MHWFAVVILSLCFILPVGSQFEVSFTEVPCPFPPPDPTIYCGRLVAPENRDVPDSNSIEIAVAVLPAFTEALPDSVFYLEGGPGSSALLSVDTWAFHPMRANRDVILFDQRGAGFSTPSLNCLEVEENDRGNFSSPLGKCRQRLIEEGIDLSQYHSAANAADVNDLREALGYEVVNLYGISYGTRLALTVMRDYPESVRSVVLDAVFPPEVDLLGDRIQNRLNSFRRLFIYCQRDPVCNNTYPNLEMIFYDLIERYNETPYRVSNPSFYMPPVIDGDEIADALFRGLYRTDAIPMLPYGLYKLYWAESDVDFRLGYELIRGFISVKETIPGYVPPVSVRQSAQVQAYFRRYGDIDFTEGVNLSVDCAEEFAFSDPNAIVRLDAQIIPDVLRDYLFFSVQSAQFRCSTWGVEQRDRVETNRVESDIPTLIISGAFDPITSVAWGDSASEGLANYQHVVFDYGGHGVSVADVCAIGMVTAHINAPHVKTHPSCVTRTGVTFYVE